MKNISGIALREFPFPQLQKVGDLMFVDGPLSSVFVDRFDQLYIYEWIDSDDSSNHWLVAKVSGNDLRSYLSQSISQLKLISNCDQGVVFILSMSGQANIEKVLLTSIETVPDEYLPDSEVYFQKDLSPDYEKIADKVKFWNEPSPIEDETEDVLRESEIRNSELLNIHLKNSSFGVRPGRVYISVLGLVLSNIDRIYKNLAISINKKNKFRILDSKKSRFKSASRSELLERTEYEWYFSKAASFSIYLKPITTNLQMSFMDQEESLGQRIFEKFSTIVNSAESLSELKAITPDFDEDAFEAIRLFMESIDEYGVDLSIAFANPLNKFFKRESISPFRAKKIKNNFTELDFTEEIQYERTGKFTALDKNIGRYKLLSFDNSKYEGKFSDDLRFVIEDLNFRSIYKAKIQRSQYKRAGKNKIEFVDTIIKVDEVTSLFNTSDPTEDDTEE
jgi:hypothetical protein